MTLLKSKNRETSGGAGRVERLAIIDLDDTLLGADKRVSPENQDALERLRANRFEIVIASGRHHQNILSYEEQVGGMNWVISSQGAVARHAATNQVLHEFTLPEAEALALFDLGRAAGLTLMAYHGAGVFTEEESEWTRLYEQRAGWKPQKANLAKLAASGLQKVLLSSSIPTMSRLGPELRRAFGERLYVVLTDDEALEFLSPRANKAFAAATVARELGLTPREAVTFGDGNNDVEMLAWAGFSVAMAHGRPGAREAAKKVSPPGPPETAFARAVDLVLAQQQAGARRQENLG